MSDEKELDQLYNKLNNGLLDKNYYKLTENTGDLTEGLTLQYVSLADTIKDRELLFVKKLTKVASHRLKDHSDFILEKLFSFNMEGTEMCDLRDYSDEGISDINLLIIQGHFFSHAGTEAHHMYMRNDYDTGWGNKSYIASHNARLALSEQRPLESAINAYFSAKMAYDLYAVTKNSFWSKRAKKGYSSFLAYAGENLDDFDESWLEIATNTLNFLRKKELGKRGEGGRNGKYNRRRRIDYL